MKRIPFAKLTPILSVLFFLLALWLLHGELARFHYRDIVNYVNTLPRGRLLEALGLTAVGYFALTGYDVLGFRYIRQSVPYPRIALASFVGYAFSNNLGMPLLTGTPVRIRFYTSWGISGLDVAKVIVFGHATFWLGFLSLSGAAFLTEPIAIPRSLGHGLLSARPLGAVFLLLAAAYLAATFFGRGRTLTIKGLELGLPGPGLGLAQLAVASLDWTLAGSVLYSLLPPAWNITFLHFLGIFLFAQVAGLLSHVPGGLGVFETLMVLLLPPELPRPELLAAMVAYRGVYYVLPLLAAAVSLGIHEIAARREQVGRLARAVGQRAPDVVPQIFAVTTFLGGAILLASGATPAIHSRLAWLRDLLPLSIIEVSHFLGSLAGVALLFLAMGLQRRLDAAYHLTLLLLAGGAVLSLAKGLDYEEAIVLSIMFTALLPCHGHFDRKASLTAQPFTPGWIAAIAIVIAGSVWLGLFAYKHVDYSTDLWWRFTFGGNAPRFLRASVGVAALALGLGLAQLLKPAPPVRQRPTKEDLARAAKIAAASPLTHAWLALLGDKQLLFHEKGDAFVMFGVEGRSWVSMGDPVGPERERRDLAWTFRETVDRHGGWACFYQVNDKNLSLYVDLGLTLVKLGEEARVPLTGFSLEGSSRKKLRHAYKRSQEEGLRFEIVPVEQVEPLLPELEDISNEWLKDKSTREKSFSLGSFSREYLKHFPVALVRHQERIVAFANLWPGGNQEELSVDLMRHRNDAPHGVMDSLFLELMLWGAAQGYRWFNLGMAPLSGLEARNLAPLWSRLGALLFRHGEHFYNFQGLRQYKDKFDPVWEPRYLACPGGLALPRILADISALIAGGYRGVLGK
ncbi:MAG TPA: bifunctional lysylphosphatidylglycerol flippase/synthetase MprF [Thermoanaerobaculia bacterium]|nr:bifunctional lysylphosphatidylglycerol flippase/synthetase MprF [Thermoanaerobaculia bacterium]